MLYFLIALLVPGTAQIFENTEGDAKTFIHRNRQSGRLAQQPSRIPDVVVERNGDSQFNFGPLPASFFGAHSRNLPHKKDKKVLVQASTSVANRVGKVPKHLDHENNNRRSLIAPTPKQRNSSAQKVNGKLGAPPQNANSQRHSLVGEKESQQAQFHNDSGEEDIREHFEGGIARTVDKPFRDPVDNRAVQVTTANGHTSYVYPEKQHPLRACFYNPSGYACCNRDLNDEIVRTYEQLANLPNFNPCNTQRIANALQRNCALRFRINFEAIVGLNDYAQRVNFKRDLVCKVELGGRYMLVYATPERNGDRVKRGDVVEQAGNQTSDEISEYSFTTIHSLLP